jgi:hypothetical protein
MKKAAGMYGCRPPFSRSASMASRLLAAAVAGFTAATDAAVAAPSAVHRNSRRELDVLMSVLLSTNGLRPRSP